MGDGLTMDLGTLLWAGGALVLVLGALMWLGRERYLAVSAAMKIKRQMYEVMPAEARPVRVGHVAWMVGVMEGHLERGPVPRVEPPTKG